MTSLGVAIPAPMLWFIGAGAGLVGLWALVKLLQGKIQDALFLVGGFLLLSAVFADGMTGGRLTGFIFDVANSFLTSFQGS